LREIETKYEETKKENEELKIEIGQLKATLEQYANAKTAKKPKLAQVRQSWLFRSCFFEVGDSKS